MAQPTATSPNNPSAPATIWGAATGSWNFFFFFCFWPSGAFNSSSATARILANHRPSLAPLVSEAFTAGPWRPKRKRGGPV